MVNNVINFALKKKRFKIWSTWMFLKVKEHVLLIFDPQYLVPAIV